MREQLRNARIDAGLTQYGLADRVNISRSHYSQIESGRKNPSHKVAVSIKVALRKTEDSLFDVFDAPRAKVGAPFKD